MEKQCFKQWLSTKDFEEKTTNLYEKNQLEHQRERYSESYQRFIQLYPDADDLDIFSAPGRIEVCGNHTDHQLGHVLAMAVDLDTVAFVQKNSEQVIRLISKDFDIMPVYLNDLSIHETEYHTTMGLIRGCAYYFNQLNGLVGGFDAYIDSNIPVGSGLSSSASIEVLIVKILDYYYGTNKLSLTDYATIAQQAENHYFNKPCGLMDQLIIAHGGFCAIDFYDQDQPEIYKFSGITMFDNMDICIVQSGSSHADLSDDYADIVNDCKILAQHFNQSSLSRVSFNDFNHALKQLHDLYATRIIMRGYHFFKENKRVLAIKETLTNQDLSSFLQLIIDSGYSSFHYLQNVLNKHDAKQGLALALMMAENHLSQQGAWRVHGGGFAGTILMFVPKDKTNQLKIMFEDVFKSNSFLNVRRRDTGVLHLISLAVNNLNKKI
jgi:galactokinase